MKKATLPKIIVILGPTSSGKSETAIQLAKKFDGEIISADSRQIYRGMDVGTGKVRGSWNAKRKVFISGNIVHYMIDIVSPETEYNVSKFKKQSEKIIEDILQRGKLPIICGGTGFWIKAIVDNIDFPEVKPDWKLRKKLEKESTEKLFEKLKKLDPKRAKTIDKNNPARLIRAIEICKSLGTVPRSTTRDMQYAFLQIGIGVPKEKLQQNIRKRLEKRWKTGMIKEVNDLHKNQQMSWKKIQSFGLGYFWIPLFLQKKLSKEELFEKVYLAEKDYAKRQITWFKKEQQIRWLKNYPTIEKEVRKFLD